MRIVSVILISLFFTFVYSCSSEIQKMDTPVVSRTFDTTFKSGIVHQKVLCKADSGITYALYLPVSYKINTTLSVVIFFDSHAKGILPVEKYKALADKFGYIIVASNNSKNGMSPAETNAIGKTIKNDVLQRFSVDEKRIYAGGFSGGSRVACSFAINDASVRGVIGCSAGFNLNNSIPNSFSFIGIAGINDMNYNELATLDKVLEKSGFQHMFLTFDGKHEWASEETMHEAFLWLYVNAVKNKTAELNQKVISEFIDKKNTLIEAAKSKNDLLQVLECNKKLAAFLTGISDVSSYQNEIARLEETPEVKNKIAEKNKIESKEQVLQQAYLEALQSKDIPWWKSEFGKINEKIRNSQNIEEKAMLNRVQGFLSLASFSFVNRALQSGDIKTAEHFNSIYKIVDPTIPDQRFFAACIYAKKSDAKNVIASIHDAVKFGLTDFERITENELLKPFLTDIELQKIKEEIEQIVREAK